MGIFALVMCSGLVFDPDYLVTQRENARREHKPFDTFGLCLLALSMTAWEIFLSKGQEWDWFGDPFYPVQTVFAVFASCLAALLFRETRTQNPLINFRTLAHRNFRSCCIIIFCAFGVLYANTTQLPGLLQSLFGCDATTSGLVLSPAGLGAILALMVVGAVLQRGVDTRYVIATGLIVMALGNLWFSRLNLSVSPWQVVWPRVVLIAGLSMIFAPLNVAAFLHVPRELRPAAVGLLALLRNEGGSVGTSMARTLLQRRGQFHTLRLNERLDPLNPAVGAFLDPLRAHLTQITGDPVRSQAMAVQALERLRLREAALLSYFDVFWASVVLAFGLVFLVLLMRRAAAEKGAHIAAE